MSNPVDSETLTKNHQAAIVAAGNDQVKIDVLESQYVKTKSYRHHHQKNRQKVLVDLALYRGVSINNTDPPADRLKEEATNISG